MICEPCRPWAAVCSAPCSTSQGIYSRKTTSYLAASDVTHTDYIQFVFVLHVQHTFAHACAVLKLTYHLWGVSTCNGIMSSENLSRAEIQVHYIHHACIQTCTYLLQWPTITPLARENYHQVLSTWHASYQYRMLSNFHQWIEIAARWWLAADQWHVVYI